MIDLYFILILFLQISISVIDAFSFENQYSSLLFETPQHLLAINTLGLNVFEFLIMLQKNITSAA